VGESQRTASQQDERRDQGDAQTEGMGEEHRCNSEEIGDPVVTCITVERSWFRQNCQQKNCRNSKKSCTYFKGGADGPWLFRPLMPDKTQSSDRRPNNLVISMPPVTVGY
jgi:hypothetical protein